MTSPRRVALVLPDLGLGALPLTVSQWLVRRDGAVVEGDRVLEVLADSVSIDVSAPASGRLVQQCVGPDDELRPGQTLGTIECESADDS